ncbi:MAG: heme lyase CcmF/NrfE family subunit [Pseudomonadota bacterium]
MTVEIGHFALVLGLVVALVQSTVPLAGVYWSDRRMMAIGGSTAGMQFLLISLSFAALTIAYVQSDFSVTNVWQNSHSDKPMLFKVTGVWGNHEGSMLLWILILAFFGALVAAFGGNLPARLRATVLAVQGWICAVFLVFVLLTSNPFIRLVPAPLEGRDLNPILQDIGLAIHPPLLYLGYVGLSVTFAFAVAALILGQIGPAWARWVRPWALAAWVFLTLGIAMGSYWAYYELGWGGWWFWDPVENASFMPWLIATALLHSAIVMEKRDALKVWTVLLAVLAFSLSLLGTFLVRSGVLTSVHAFATDPARGVFILGILVAFIGGSLALYAWRAPTLKMGGIFAPVSREGALVLNNLFLTVACATVLVGTLYPLALEAVNGQKISVGPPFFNLTFGPLMIPLLLLVPFGPFLSWKRADLLAVTQRLWAAAGLALLATAIWAYATAGTPILALAGIAIGFWLIMGAMAEIAHRIKLFQVPVSVALARAGGLPRSAWGTMVAHAGVGVMMLGIVASTATQTESIQVMQPNDTVEAGPFIVRFDSIGQRSGPNFREDVATITVLRQNTAQQVTTLEPSKRFYPARQMPTTEAGIHTHWFSQVFVTLGDPIDAGQVVTVYYKPFITLIWIGCLIMSLGGVLSLTDRRLRVGAPAKAKVAPRPAEAPA